MLISLSDTGASKPEEMLHSIQHDRRPQEPYPDSFAARDRWIIGHRPPRNRLDPWIPYAFFVEPETGPERAPVDVATVFLTNRECPWRCLMCDLWRNTLEETVPDGAIAAALSIPFDGLVAGELDRLYGLKASIVQAGVEAVTGIRMPVYPKRRFQEGAGGDSYRRWRVSKAWCRQVFLRQWEERLRHAWEPASERVSGNAVPAS